MYLLGWDGFDSNAASDGNDDDVGCWWFHVSSPCRWPFFFFVSKKCVRNVSERANKNNITVTSDTKEKIDACAILAHILIIPK